MLKGFLSHVVGRRFVEVDPWAGMKLVKPKMKFSSEKPRRAFAAEEVRKTPDFVKGSNAEQYGVSTIDRWAPWILQSRRSQPPKPQKSNPVVRCTVGRCPTCGQSRPMKVENERLFLCNHAKFGFSPTACDTGMSYRNWRRLPCSLSAGRSGLIFRFSGSRI